MNSEPVILKMDDRGRVRTPRVQREALLDEFERSGLSGMRFAALHGLKYPSFANWVQGRRRRRADGLHPHAGKPAGGPAALQWLEAEVQTGERSHQSSGLLLHLPGGMRLELTHPQQVGLAAALVQALAPHSSNAGARPAPRPC